MNRLSLPRTLALVCLPLGGGCSYSVLIDTAAEPILNSVEGEVTFAGAVEPGPVMVLVFSADDPPPPMGTGKPVTFATVPAESFTDGAQGLRSAPFGVYGIPDGDWLFGALMDMDGDFQPLLSSNAGTTCGDWSGGYPADLAGTSGLISLSGGELVDQVPLLVTREVSTERPAFRFVAGGDVVKREYEATTDLVFQLESTGVASPLVTLEGPYDPATADTCDTMFLVEQVDEDGDGVADPHWVEDLAVNGLKKTWPRVYVQYLGDGAVKLAEGERYAAEAGIDRLGPDVPEAADAEMNGTPILLLPVNTPTPYTRLDVDFLPGARHYLPDGTLEVVLGADVPAGSWSVTVVAKTGQTWTLPNETAGYPSLDAAFDPAGQAGVVIAE